MAYNLTKKIVDVTHHIGPNGDPVPGGLVGNDAKVKKPGK